MKRLFYIVLGVMLTAIFSSANAADYPTRPITFMTMVQPGAQVDRLACGLSQRMSIIWDSPST